LGELWQAKIEDAKPVATDKTVKHAKNGDAGKRHNAAANFFKKG
jgi:hypothetical protein